jgi:hypothetical protein
VNSESVPSTIITAKRVLAATLAPVVTFFHVGVAISYHPAFADSWEARPDYSGLRNDRRVKKTGQVFLFLTDKRGCQHPKHLSNCILSIMSCLGECVLLRDAHVHVRYLSVWGWCVPEPSRGRSSAMGNGDSTASNRKTLHNNCCPVCSGCPNWRGIGCHTCSSARDVRTGVCW